MRRDGSQNSVVSISVLVLALGRSARPLARSHSHNRWCLQAKRGRGLTPSLRCSATGDRAGDDSSEES